MYLRDKQIVDLSLHMFESECKKAALFSAKFYDNLITENHSDLRLTLYVFVIV